MLKMGNLKKLFGNKAINMNHMSTVYSITEDK